MTERTKQTVNGKYCQRDIPLTVSKRSKQQKLILVSLRSVADQAQNFSQLYRLIEVTTGVDAGKLEREYRQFHLYRGKGAAPPWRQVEARSTDNRYRKLVNDAYAKITS